MENLLENKEFIDAFTNITSPMELKASYEKFNLKKEEGITWERLYDVYRTEMSKQDEELNEEQLQDVAGGLIVTPVTFSIVKFIKNLYTRKGSGGGHRF